MARQLGENFFNEKLNPICLNWLKDPVFTIREAAINNVKQLIIIFGPAWTSKHLFPKLLALHTESNYLHRLTPLFAMQHVACVLSADLIKKQLLPVLVTMSKDKVPNIRMNIAKTISAFAGVAKGHPDLEVSERA